MAARHRDDKPLPCHESERHVTYHDGFTDLWRRCLWTAVKAEMYGGTAHGWHLLERMVALAGDAEREGRGSRNSGPGPGAGCRRRWRHCGGTWQWGGGGFRGLTDGHSD